MNVVTDLKMSKHAKQRLYERYNIKNKQFIDCIISNANNPNTYVLVDCDLHGEEIRRIKFNKRKMDLVVSGRTIVTIYHSTQLTTYRGMYVRAMRLEIFNLKKELKEKNIQIGLLHDLGDDGRGN